MKHLHRLIVTSQATGGDADERRPAVDATTIGLAHAIAAWKRLA
jgi:hypothetical protein